MNPQYKIDNYSIYNMGILMTELTPNLRLLVSDLKYLDDKNEYKVSTLVLSNKNDKKVTIEFTNTNTYNLYYINSTRPSLSNYPINSLLSISIIIENLTAYFTV